VAEQGSRHAPGLSTPAVVAAHPAALMLALVAGKLVGRFDLTSIAATVMEPASQYGRAAMDELHQQTVNLLSFQSLPREQFDAQVAFNLLPELGEQSKVRLDSIEHRIRKHYAALSDGRLPELALQMVQAPVFHGYVVSILVELGQAATALEFEEALSGEHFELVRGDSDPPSNISAAGQGDIMIRVRKNAGDSAKRTRFWIWLAADNLKLVALNAIACALELEKLRPLGKVQ
jgi:aspartate-semialdehyde dehydrogenase